MCNFCLIQAKNRRLKMRFVFCDFPRRSVSSDVKWRRYIQAFILRNIFICASNQNPPGLIIENVIFCWMCNFYLIQTKNRRLKVRFVFCEWSWSVAPNVLNLSFERSNRINVMTGLISWGLVFLVCHSPRHFLSFFRNCTADYFMS